MKFLLLSSHHSLFFVLHRPREYGPLVTIPHIRYCPPSVSHLNSDGSILILTPLNPAGVRNYLGGYPAVSLSPLRPQEPCTGAMSDLLTAVILACIYSSAYHARDYDPHYTVKKN